MDVPLLTLNKLNTLHVFKIMYIRRGNDGLNAFMNELQQIVPSRLVELAQHIVQEQYGIFAYFGFNEF